MSAGCPVCRKQVFPRSVNAAFPFCCERCRLLDLGRWMDGDYRIPGPPVDLPEQGLEADEEGEA